MVRAYAFPIWSWNFSADAAHRSLLNVWWHPHRGTLLHGPGADRTKIRHCPGTLARHVSGFSATARARIFALFYLAPFQADTAERHSRTRTFTSRGETGPGLAPANFLERRRA